MLVFEVLDDVVEIIHTDSIQHLEFQESQQTGAEGKNHWRETKGLFLSHYVYS